MSERDTALGKQLQNNNNYGIFQIWAKIRRKEMGYERCKTKLNRGQEGERA